MATHSGRSYNSHQLGQLHQGQFLPAGGGVGAKVGDLRQPLVFGYSSRLRSPTAAYQALWISLSRRVK